MDKPRKNIYFDLRLLPFGGGGVYAFKLLEALLKLDQDEFDFTAVVNKDILSNVASLSSRINCLIASSKPLSLMQHIDHAFIRRDCDLYHYPHFDMPLLQLSKAVLTVLDIYPVSVDAYCSKPKTEYFRWLTHLNMARAKTIITISEHTKKDILKHFDLPEAKIVPILLAADSVFRVSNDSRQILRNREKYGIKNDYIFYIGNHKPHKNLIRLISAYGMLPDILKEKYQLVLAGSKDERYNDVYAEASRVGPGRIIFPGKILADDLPLLYNGATLFAFPSVYEGFGIPPLEAMACGVPVVASNAASLPEVVGDAGVMFDPLDRVALSQALRSVLANEQLRLKMRANGLKRAKLFSWDLTAIKTLSVYEGAIKEK